MKKIFLSLSTGFLIVNPSFGTQIFTNQQTENKKIINYSNYNNIDLSNNSLENWYKFLAPNEWKVIMRREVFNNVLIPIKENGGRFIKQEDFAEEVKQVYNQFSKGGNRNFSDYNLYQLGIQLWSAWKTLEILFNQDYKSGVIITSYSNSNKIWKIDHI